MLYALLVVVAIGILLISEEGKCILGYGIYAGILILFGAAFIALLFFIHLYAPTLKGIEDTIARFVFPIYAAGFVLIIYLGRKEIAKPTVALWRDSKVLAIAVGTTLFILACAFVPSIIFALVQLYA